MKGKLALLLAASSTISGYATGEQSLQQAIDRILANNCRGIMDTGGGFSGGLFTESEVTTEVISQIEVGDPSFSLSVFELEEIDGEFVVATDINGNSVELGVPDAWITGNMLTVPDTAGADVFGLSIQQLDSGDFDLRLNIPTDASEYFSYGGEPVLGSVTFNGLGNEVVVKRLPARDEDGGQPDNTLNFVRAILAETQTVSTVTETGPTSAASMGLGIALTSVCTTQSSPQLGERITEFTSDFLNTNIDGGTFGAAGPVGLTNPPTNSILSSTGTNGAQALQNRELTLRRDQSLWSRIQRLWSRGDRERDRRRREQAALRPYKVAALGSYAPAPQPAIRDYSFVTDLSGGAVNVDRSATDLEGAFSADSFVVNAGAGVLFHGNGIEGSTLLVGGALSYEETQADGESRPSSGQTQSFRSETESEALITSAFASWTSGPIGGDAEQGGRLNLTASYSFGTADTNYSRDFSTTIERDGVEDRVVRDIFKDDVDQTFQTLTVRGSYNHQIGDLTLTPRASASWVRFETDAHEEESIVSGTSSLALRYEAVEDDWAELRVGAAATYRAPTGPTTALRLGVGVDAVFVDDAETPERTAFFAQDLRANPTPIVYSVDDLDSEYFDINLSIAFENGSRFEPYLAGFSRQGHDYLDSQGGLIGIRTVF